MASIHIARGGELLGAFSDEQVLEGIRAGSFKAGDHVWMEGMEDWTVLDEMARHWGVELPPAQEAKGASPAPTPAAAAPQSQPKTQSLPKAVQGAAPVAKPAPAPAPKPRTPATAPAAQVRAAAPSKKVVSVAAAESFAAEAVPVLAIAVEGEMGPAWEQRKTLGFFPALLGTIKGVLLQPGPTFSGMKSTGGLGGPLGFYLILVWVSALVTAGAKFFLGSSLQRSIIMPLIKLGMLPRGLSGAAKHAAATGAMEIGILLMVMLGTVIVMVLSLFLVTGIVHLLLKLFGGAKQPYETTFRVYCYSESASALKLIPGLGWLLALPWSLCCQIIGLKNAHGTETWRAVLAVFLPFIFCCCSIVSPLAFALAKPAKPAAKQTAPAKPAVKQSAPAKPSAQKPPQKASVPNKAPQKKPSPAPKAKH